MILQADKIDYKHIRAKRKPVNKIDPLILEKNADHGENMRLIEQCRRYYESMEEWRSRRRRNRRFNRGDQWGDRIPDPDHPGRYITEEEYLRRQGKVPLKQNLFRMILKNLLGQYRSNSYKSVVVSRTVGDSGGSEMLTNAMQHVHQLNYVDELDARQIEEFALSGIVCGKINYKYFKTRNEEDIYIKNTITPRLFFNTDITDPRGDDLRLIGEIHDVTIDDLIASFAKTPADEKRIRDLYSINGKNEFMAYTGLKASSVDRLSFYLPEEPEKARMIEVWQLVSEWRMKVHDWADGSYKTYVISQKEIDRENELRIKFGVESGLSEEEIPLLDAEPIKEQFWTVKFLTPHGHLLFAEETPYLHEEHPYAIIAYPLIDSEVWGFMEDIIDQQKYVNRMVIMMDFIMSAAAKGVLMVPEDQIPDGWTPEMFAEEWRSFNGVILYKPSQKHNHIPHQITAASATAGITEMLQLQMQFVNDISGIHSAIQGKSPSSGTPASLYAQEAQNASTNTLDFFHTFSFYQRKRDEKILKLILQYYKEERYFAIAGEKDSAKLFTPDKVAGKLYDLNIAQGIDTPVYKQMIDDTLFKLLEMQMIDAEIFLENTSLPFAHNILESIKQKKEQIQKGEMPTGEMPLGQQQANPQAMQMINQALGKVA